MSTSVTFNGNSYLVPARGETGWGGATGVDGLLIALGNYALGPTTATFVNVKTYGALGDALTDDTLAIQAALSSLTSGGVIYFPHGIYMVSGALVPLNGTTLLGDGRNSTTIKIIGGYFSTIDTAIVQATNLKNFRCAGIKFDGGGSWSGVAFANPYGGGSSVGFSNDNVGISVVYGSTSVENIVVTDCEFTGLGLGIAVFGNRGTEKVTVSNNNFITLGKGAVRLYQTNVIQVNNNYVEGVYGNLTAAGVTSTALSKFGDGILVLSLQGGVISGNVITNFIRGGILVEPDTGVTHSCNTHTSTTINGISDTSDIRASMWVVGSGVVLGTKVVSVDSSSSITVSIATTSTLTGTSITFDAQTKGLAISDNVIHGQVNSKGTEHGIGIYVGDGCTLSPISLSGNLIYDLFGTGTSSAGTGGVGIHAQTCTVTGGGIYNCTYLGIEWDGGDVNIVGVDINANKGGVGFPATMANPQPHRLSIRTCTIRENTFYGIGMSDVSGGTTVEIIGNTIEDNGGGTTPLGVNNEGLGLSGIVCGGFSAPSLPVIRNNTFISSANAGATVGQLYAISTYSGAATLLKTYVENNSFIFTGTLAAVGTLPSTFATFTSGGGTTAADPFVPGVRGNTSNKASSDDAWTTYSPTITTTGGATALTFTSSYFAWNYNKGILSITGNLATRLVAGAVGAPLLIPIPPGYTVIGIPNTGQYIGGNTFFKSGTGRYAGAAMYYATGYITFHGANIVGTDILDSSFAASDGMSFFVTLAVVAP